MASNPARPWRFEAGTPNIAGVIGLSAALEWLEETDIAQAENWSRGLATLAEEAGETSGLPLLPLPGRQPAGV
jgi:selenocysteine lyase/cysteine desulfurase